MSGAFAPRNELPRSPRPSDRVPVSESSPSTLEKVLHEKEARRAAEEEQRLKQLHDARVEHFGYRKRLLASAKVFARATRRRALSVRVQCQPHRRYRHTAPA